MKGRNDNLNNKIKETEEADSTDVNDGVEDVVEEIGTGDSNGVGASQYDTYSYIIFVLCS